MIWLRFKYKIKQIIPKLKFRPNFNMSFDRILLLAIFALSCIYLLQSIYTSLQNGIQNHKILNDRIQERNELLEENEELKAQVEYFESDFYQKRYARESLNLAEPGQQLYFVERIKTYDFDSELEKGEPINVNNYRFWWKTLLL